MLTDAKDPRDPRPRTLLCHRSSPSLSSFHNVNDPKLSLSKSVRCTRRVAPTNLQKRESAGFEERAAPLLKAEPCYPDYAVQPYSSEEQHGKHRLAPHDLCEPYIKREGQDPLIGWQDVRRNGCQHDVCSLARPQDRKRIMYCGRGVVSNLQMNSTRVQLVDVRWESRVKLGRSDA